MRTTNLIVYFVGLAIVLAAVWLLFMQTGLSRYIPAAVVGAIVLLILGIAVMGASERFRGGHRDRTVVYDQGPGVPPAPPAAGYRYERREVYDDDTRRYP